VGDVSTLKVIFLFPQKTQAYLKIFFSLSFSSSVATPKQNIILSTLLFPLYTYLKDNLSASDSS